MNEMSRAVNTRSSNQPVPVWCAAALCGAAVLGLSSHASAELGKKGSFSIGAERLFGLYSNHAVIERDGPLPDISTTAAGVGIFYQANSSAFAIPRLTFDYFVADRWSVGTALGYYNNSPDTGIDSQSGFILAPRAGYAFSFNERFGIMPHAGFTYFHTNTELVNDDDDRSTSLLALALDGTFFFMPTPNVGFTGALVLDFGLTGSTEEPIGDRNDYHEQLLGLEFGMFAHF